MKHFILSIYLLVLSLIVSAPPIESATYCVDQNHPNASDTNAGSENDPWLTIRHAGITVTAGDTVLVKEGIYNEHLHFENTGTQTAGYIIFSAYPDDTPVIDGSGVTESSNGIIIDKSYVKLLGIEVCNWNGNGIWIENCGYVEISDCLVHDVSCGIGVFDGAHDFELNRTVVHHFLLYGFDASPSEEADCYNGILNDCTAHTGYDPDQNVDGFALGHGNQHDFVFNHCTAYDVFDGFDISSRNTILNGCIAHDCWNGCYKLWQDRIFLINCIGYRGNGSIVELDWDGDPGTVTLTNCTFFDSGTYGIWIENRNDTLKMMNCILAGGDNIGLAFEQTGTVNYFGNYNLFHHNQNERAIAVAYTDEFTLDQIENGSWTNYSGQDAHSLVSGEANAIFLNPVQFDLNLMPSSIAVDHGTSVNAPLQDIEGNPRPLGNGFDIGAYEYPYSTGATKRDAMIVPVSSARLYQNYPNPFNPETAIRFYLPVACEVRIEIYNLKGETINTLMKEELSAGYHTIQFSATDKNGSILPSGIYFYSMKTDDFQNMKKLTLIR
ncbi:right-handed parallel beta-helix repeat-containing protein [bacterium]|nr:right-handed parallel beta-helix repeat-containing protein [bacterium]